MNAQSVGRRSMPPVAAPDSDQRPLRIGELAARTGMTVKAIRYYERIGLLPRPRRAANGYRVYDAEAVARAQFIQRAKHLGLSLAEVRDLIEVAERGGCGPLRVSVAQLLAAKLADCHRRIAALESLATALEEQHRQALAVQAELVCVCPVFSPECPALPEPPPAFTAALLTALAS